MTYYRHKKTGGEYELLHYAKMQTATWTDQSRPDQSPLSSMHDSETVDMREVAVYKSLSDGRVWVRPREEFEDGRFEELTSKIVLEDVVWHESQDAVLDASLARKS